MICMPRYRSAFKYQWNQGHDHIKGSVVYWMHIRRKHGESWFDSMPEPNLFGSLHTTHFLCIVMLPHTIIVSCPQESSDISLRVPNTQTFCLFVWTSSRRMQSCQTRERHRLTTAETTTTRYTANGSSAMCCQSDGECVLLHDKGAEGGCAGPPLQTLKFRQAAIPGIPLSLSSIARNVLGV